MLQKYETRFPSELGSIHPALEEAVRFVTQCAPNLPPDDRLNVRLIFSELLSNAVIHGNRSDARKMVHLYIHVDNDILQAQISDEGPGFDYDALINRPVTASALESEHGRGLKLVSELTDSLSFRKNGCEIHFHKRLCING